MREKEILQELEDVTLLNQFLYMNEDNFIEYNQDDGTTLEIRLNENLDYISNYSKSCGALSYLVPLRVTNSMNLSTLIGIIENLKKQEPILKNTRFQNRWEEIKDTTLANLSLNLLKKEQVLESETNTEENRERVKAKLKEMISKKNIK